MDAINFTKNRFTTSVHYGRAGLNARYEKNAREKAMSLEGSLFLPRAQSQTFSYKEDVSKSYLAGNVTGRVINLVKDNWSSISKYAVGAFNTLKGWFS